ncbi:MAG: hypothetical protein J3K34DRAFT_84874 [Monoraphidium minutum]|nr:MAG: hypothetical protein J3K34DRAFT_84874 [Monoraphidium minutum]
MEGGTRLGWRRRRAWRAVPGLGGAGGRAWRAVPGLGGARSVPARRYQAWKAACSVHVTRYRAWAPLGACLPASWYRARVVPAACVRPGTRLGWCRGRVWRAVPGLDGRLQRPAGLTADYVGQRAAAAACLQCPHRRHLPSRVARGAHDVHHSDVRARLQGA